jgi:hypothetical protein
LWVWWSRLGQPENDFPSSGVYTALSPSLKRRLEFDDAEIQREFERIADAALPGLLGEALFLQAPFFLPPSRAFDTDVVGWLDDYGLCKALGKGRSGATLDDESAFFLDAIRIIANEEICVENYVARKMKLKGSRHG